jgi:hypothetical protein
MKKFAILAPAIAAALFATSARADFELRIGDTADAVSVTVVDNGPGDLNPAPGVILYSATVGEFFISVTTAMSKPVIGSASSPFMDLDVVATKLANSQADTLTVMASDTDFSPPPAGWQVGFGGTISNGFLTYQAFAGNSNTDFDTSGNASPVLIGTSPVFSGVASFLSSSPSQTPDPYSLTQTIVITVGAGSSVTSVDDTLTALPEPSSMAMLVAGVPVLGMLWARRRKAKAAKVCPV